MSAPPQLSPTDADAATARQAPARRVDRTRRLLFAFFAMLYALSSMGRTNSTDGLDVYNTAKSLLLRHSLAISPDIGTFIGRGGATYAKYGIGQSLAELPLVQVDQWAHQLGLFLSAPQLFSMMTNAWVTAAGVVVLYQLARDFGYAKRPALATALVYGLATPAWVYAKLDFSEPMLALLLLLAALGAYRFRVTGSARWAALVGAALGYAVLTKYAAIVFVLLFAVYLALAWRQWARVPNLQLALAALGFGAPVVAGIAGTLAVNWARSGSPWVTGYLAYERPFNQSVPLTLHAAAALLISPRYGLLFFATPVLIGLLGFAAFRRRHPLEAWGIATLAGATLLLYASYPTWYAGWTWGPRFLVPIVPLCLLPAVEVLGTDGRTPRVTRYVRLALLAGLAEQALGVLVNYRAPYDVLPWWTHPQTAHIWTPWTSPLLIHALLLPVSAIANLGLRVPGSTLLVDIANTQLAQLGQFFPFFWFSRFPNAVVALVVGAPWAVVALVLCGRALVGQLTAAPEVSAADARVAEPSAGREPSPL
jgi:4-amino-4-deoxy-L-arabinose transferase-like glycosyltransferase